MAYPLARRTGRAIANRLFAPPRRGHHRTPAELGLGFTESVQVTSDGVDLHLWLLEPPERATVGAAIVGHGIGLTKSASLRQAAMLRDAGCGVVMYDHRNHGLSGRDTVRPGMADRFTLDIEAAAVRAAEEFGLDRPVLAYGFSFSSFPSVYVLRHSAHIGAVVCDSGPGADIAELLTGFAEAGALPLPRWLLATPWGRQAVAACGARATELLDSDWPPPAADGALDRTPMLFIVGSADDIVRAEQVQAVADLYGEARCVVLNGSHLDCVKQDPQAYREALEDFLGSMERQR